MPPLERGEAVPRVQRRDALVPALDLEVDGAGAARPRELERRLEEPRADPALARLGEHVQLLEPCAAPAVLDRPRERQRGDADRARAVVCQQERRAVRPGEEGLDGVRHVGGRRGDGVVAELRHEQVDQRGAVPARRDADLRR